MYQRPLILDSVAHATCKMAPITRFDFARELNSCVVLGEEIPEAAKCYPVLFSRTSDDELIAVAILGLKDNLFLAPEGTWEPGAYLPAFIRRYPYLLAEGVTGDGALSVCIDADYTGFGGAEGEPLFQKDGSPSDSLAHAIEFLKLFQNQYLTTRDFVARLDELKLFKAVDANISLSNGDNVTLPDLLTVDEEALLKLSDAQLAGLARSGQLAWIYAQQGSLNNFNGIVSRAEHVVSQKKA